MIDLKQYEVWFVTGSQMLYGEQALRQVADHSQQISKALDAASQIAPRVVCQPVLKEPDAITSLCRQANASPQCVGLIVWMHTFSPAKMWIAGLRALGKPLAHLHTQFNRDIPWDTIDMDFMNLNQSAHGGREFGFINACMGIERKVIVGHWQDQEVLDHLDVWSRAACGWGDLQGAKFARLGDNMRNVAVTEGDKVQAQAHFGYSVNGYGMGDLAEYLQSATDKDVEMLIDEYEHRYILADALKENGEKRQSLRDAARIELALRRFLEDGQFKGFTDTFENLHGLKQLPGIAAQRLMAEGYGFGAEGDWKTAALLRAMKVMAAGLDRGTSFMEDYTYHLHPDGQLVLGAHMLEICESIAADQPRAQIHPLDIGGKDDPVRLVFTAPPGDAINASIIDMGHRFRLIVNAVQVVKPEHELPKLPVARALWKPLPNVKEAAKMWILAGGAHHTGFSQALTAEHMQDFAAMANVEYLHIDERTQVDTFMKELRWNDVYYRLSAAGR